MVYTSHNLPEVADELPSTIPRREPPLLNVGTLHSQCESVSSKQLFRDAGRKKRQCVVCRYEERYPTEVTDYCHTHSVCLCRVMHDHVEKPYICPQSTWTCWDKFHRFYLPNGLFTDKGNVRRTSQLAKLKAQHCSKHNS
eukprot:jgi/Phyca11/111085/e_gw1.19.646.1